MPNASTKIRIIVFFGDITGFTDFCESITNDKIEYDPLMDEFDKLVDKIEEETGYKFDETGDGFMCSVELASRHPGCKAVEMVLKLWDLLKRIEMLFLARREKFITPDGFRIVGATGYVKKKIKKKGRIVLRGKHINLAHNGLTAARGHGFVCHSSLKNLIGDRLAKKHGITFFPLDKSLWILNVSGA